MDKIWSHSAVVLILFVFIGSPSIGSQEWYKEYSPETWKVTTAIKEYVKQAPGSSTNILLGMLHVYADSPDRKSLKVLADIAIKNARPWQLFDVALMCQKVGFRRLASYFNVFS